MANRRETILILEDTPARIERFERVLQSQLANADRLIVNTKEGMLGLLEQHLDRAFAISLDHDLYVSGVDDPGDGLQVATELSKLTPCCRVIIHTSNSDKSRQMQGVLEAERWDVRLAGAIGEDWIEKDWITEVAAAYKSANAQ